MNVAKLAPYFADEAKATELVEKKLWPNGPVCPHCQATDRIRRLEGVRTKRTKANPEGVVRHGLWKCYHCRKQFTVRVGTVFEDSHIGLNLWLFAIYLMCSSKKGVSANQLKRELGITYRSAWFMCHRVREMMREEPLRSMLGSTGKIVEVDETFVGGDPMKNKHKNKTAAAGKKTTVMTLIERGGEVRTLVIPDRKRATLFPIIEPLVDSEAQIMTDKLAAYDRLRSKFKKHQSVNHRKMYVRGIVHTNFAESYHSLLKRGILGTFHHVSSTHLPMYLQEFEFRWNSRKTSDSERTGKAISGARGKRLMYKQPVSKG
jgi:transposase-like protein